MSSRTRLFAVFAVLITMASALCGAVAITSDESEAASSATVTIDVGTTYNGNTIIYTGVYQTVEGSITGVTLSTMYVQPLFRVMAKGTFSTAGNYTLTLSDPMYDNYDETMTLIVRVVKDAPTVSDVSYTVGDTVSNTSVYGGSYSSVSASIPGVSLSVIRPSSQIFIVTATGTFTTAGTYPVTLGDSYAYYADTTFNIVVSEPAYTCYLYYSANGGSGAPSTDSYSSSSTSSHSFTVSSTVPTRSGYTFLGWSTSSSASSATYQAGDTISVSYSGSKTLYAVWQQNTQTYSAVLSYSANGGSGAPANQTGSMTGTSASGSKTFTISSTVPTRSGYDFLGWSTSSTATAATYHAGDTISVSYGSSLTLYAVWQQASITVSGTPSSYGVVGTAWTYTPTISVSGCTLSVSGASWIVAADGTLTGTPPSTGTYDVTLTVSKTGYVSATQTFSITVLAALSFESSPEGGAIIYAV